jgi:type-F conjugative transfer system pilin assembly protein TrbC
LEEKKLLFPLNNIGSLKVLFIALISLITISDYTKANDNSPNDQESFVEVIDEIQNQYQNNLTSIFDAKQVNENGENGENVQKGQAKNHFYIFVTLSMSEHNLKQLIIYARKYNATLVLRGLVDNSFVKTSSIIQKLSEESGGMIIDPNLFKEFNIKTVPSYVLASNKSCPLSTTCVKTYDKLTGNVTPKYALEIFKEKGDLAAEAKLLLGASL